jgi:antitoxin component YwqK of YwqJK toxin-antitoxin module
MINETTLAELLFPQIQDPKTWCKLAQVSKRFNEVFKRKLIKKERTDFSGAKEVWTELPNGQKHGPAKGLYSSGHLAHIVYYNQGELHGTNRYWYRNGQLIYKLEYKHGICKIE